MIIKKSFKKHLVGLDIGTTKICVAVGELSKNGITITSINTTSSLGLKKGTVINIESTVNSIRKVINDAERFTGKPIHEVLIAVTGSHIKGEQVSTSTYIKNDEVTSQDIETAISSINFNIPPEREILQIVPTDFILDGASVISDPVGLSGFKLDINSIIITGSSIAIQNLIECCRRAGLEIKDITLQSIASAEATLYPEEKKNGIAIIDLGGGTTDIAVYKDDYLKYVSVIALGGNHFTNDLSIGLGLTFQEAERIKIKNSNILLSEESKNSEIDIYEISGQIKKIPQKYLLEILLPRAEEFISLIKKELTKINKLGINIGSIVMTGGASLLHSLDKLAQATLSLPVRIGYPKASVLRKNSSRPFLTDLLPEHNNPIYSTSIGLLLYGSDQYIYAEEDSSATITIKMSSLFKKTFSKIGGFNV